jgi:ribosomal protein L24E
MNSSKLFLKEFSKGMVVLTPKKQQLLPLRPSYLTHFHSDKKSVPDSLRNEIQARDDYSCRFCGHRVIGGKGMHTHHLNSIENTRENLVTCCIACHTVNHIGRGLAYGSIEIWKSPFSQVEIVRMSRKAVAEGKTLVSVKKKLKLKAEYLEPDDIKWTRVLNRPRATGFLTYLDELDKDLRVIFVKFKPESWQL